VAQMAVNNDEMSYRYVAKVAGHRLSVCLKVIDHASSCTLNTCDTES
jgi:hypothetical protein